MSDIRLYNHTRQRLQLALLTCACLPGWAMAMIAAGAGAGLGVGQVAGASEPSKQVVIAAPTATGGPSVEWVSAGIGGLQLTRGEITLRGKPVALHPTRLQVLTSDGRRGEPAMLHVGQAIRFALDDAPAPGRRIVLIQIER